MKTLVVLDERWHSALTDLGIKVAKILKGSVACAVLKGYPAEKEVKSLGLSFFYIEDPRKSLPFKPFFSLKRVLEEFNPDIVITIRGDELLFASLLKKKLGFKLFRIHGEAKGIRDTVLNRFLHEKFVDGVILSSKQLLNNVVINIPKVFVHGAVDTEKFRFSKSGRERIRKELKVESSILLGIVGRLDPVKGHALFLKSLSILLKKGLDVKGLVVGEEKNIKLSELKGLAESLKISDKVIFIPEKRKDIVDIMSAVDIGVVSSIGSEMIARVPLEFMACGRPIIVTNVGVLPEIVKKEFGEVVDLNENLLSKGIERIILKDLRKLGNLARKEAVSKYSMEKLSEVINSFIRNEV
ncbi:MAG: glycosyltransferase [Desulfurobacteriaceae bacterium]